MLNRTLTYRGSKHGSKWRTDIAAWVVMLPGLVLFAFFIWEPLIEALRLSLYEANGMRVVRFVGLDNYRSVLLQPDFWPAVGNTFMYLLWSLIIGFLLPIVLAIFIHESTRAKSLYRTAVYLPNILPSLATVFLWRYLFKSDDYGGLNMLLSLFGVPAQDWLNNSTRVIPLIVVTMTWKGAGATALLYLAGLQGINPELYEAAIIDGANIRQRISHVTIPQLYNLARTLLILQVIAVFQILYEPLVMTNGGPNNASVSLMQLVFRYAFEKYDYSRASAVSVLISIALITLTLIYNKVNKEKEL
ncbi:MAG: sugar ABC transporter permease [Eubacteriales bacterium]|nr:sugar ABC transporter permease [Eubacteriales bacterium]